MKVTVIYSEKQSLSISAAVRMVPGLDFKIIDYNSFKIKIEDSNPIVVCCIPEPAVTSFIPFVINAVRQNKTDISSLFFCVIANELNTLQRNNLEDASGVVIDFVDADQSYEVRLKFEDQQPDSSLRPNYYGGQNNPYEVIKIIDALELDFQLGNALKYIARAGKKNSDTILEDLNKAKTYIDLEIKKLKL